jgi:hypothetical protein
MTEEMKKWEYRVQTFGTFWTVAKQQDIQQALNEWGEQGWEVVSTHIIENVNKINVIAKRPLTREIRRSRSMPQ